MEEDYRSEGPTYSGYFSIDYEIVWDIVVNKIPDLKTRMDAISLNE